ncbi:MAG: trimethylamine methyltransferase family protein [Desulfobacterales bacterium]|nr:trimethylamine methyltransferase family protein [Desulfobacterales bacterium]
MNTQIPEAQIPEEKLVKLEKLTLDIMEQVGIKILSTTYLDRLKALGFKVCDDRIYFDRDEVNETLAKAPVSFSLKAVNPDHDLEIGTGLSKIAPGYGCSSVMDAAGNVRDACFKDHLELVKLTQASPELQFNGGILAQPSDVPVAHQHLAMHYASLVYSDKCLMGMPGSLSQVNDLMVLTAIRAGGEEKLAAHPRLITMVSPISPLQIDEMTLDSIEAAVRYSQPVMASSGVAAGTTGPIDLASNVAMAAAECLAVIMVVQAINPGNPVIFGLQCYGADMISGNISIGSPAYALQAKYTAALARRWGMPSRCGGTTNDAKSLSAQAGYESMLSMFTAMENNVSVIVHGAGILDSFAGISFEKFIMDLEIIRMNRFYLDDMEISDATLNLDLIQEVGPGGLFIMSMDTLTKCRTHAWTPAAALRGSVKGMTPDEKLLDNIQKTRNQLLAGYVQPEIDADILNGMNRFMADKGVDLSMIRA